MIKEWRKLTTKEHEMIDKEKSVVILPIASCEQHGAHLSVATDQLVLELFTKSLLEMQPETEKDFYILPPMLFGDSNEHMGFSGTITLRPQTLMLFVEDIASSLCAGGYKKVLIMNSHGGNTGLLDAIGQKINLDYGVEMYTANLLGMMSGCSTQQGVEDMDESVEIHAGDIETSVLLYAFPESVKMQFAQDSPVHIPIYNNSWVTKKISTSGVLGLPTKATADKGRIIFNYAMQKLILLMKSL